MTSPSRPKTFLDLFPVPEFLLLSTTGIVITDTDTKFVQLRREIFGDGFELAHATKVANPKGVVESGLINNPAELVPILKKLASHYHISYARASLPDEKAYLFTTTISWVPSLGLRDAVAFIVEENVPMSLSESIFDFEVISEDKNTDEIKVTVSVLPKSIVSTYITAFESAGITPISFDIESQAIARAVIRHGDKRPNLIVNLSLKKTGFYLIEEGVVQFSTTSAYGVDGVNSPENLSNLKAEMRKVLIFWSTRTDKLGKSGQKIEKIVLCGLGASSKDFVDKLMSESDIPYVLADVWLNTSSKVPEMLFNESLDYASAIGLVLPSEK